jgi:RimJ/RimL family protein N-acetyltransferase
MINRVSITTRIISLSKNQALLCFSKHLFKGILEPYLVYITNMKLIKYQDPVQFHQAAAALLQLHEAENNLPLGILSGILAGDFADRDPYLGILTEGKNPILAVISTPPHPALLSFFDGPVSIEMVNLVINELDENLGENFSGLTGYKQLVAQFKPAAEAIKGKQLKIKMALRIYKLEQVNPVTGVPGEIRPLNPGDQDLMVDWYSNFIRDGLGEEPEPELVEKLWKRYLKAETLTRGLMFWEVDGQPVSMAGYSGPTPHGIRIGAVYTPPDFRRKGYASACTAALSQFLLDQGYTFCFLFTDLLNPTSNHIYQEIGYQAVCDVDRYQFE